MLHRSHLEWPCLTFNFVSDTLGQNRIAFPHTAYVVAGTQADSAAANRLLCLKFSHLCKTKHDDESEPESEASGHLRVGMRAGGS
jgi:ribosome assembly protein RRB1